MQNRLTALFALFVLTTAGIAQAELKVGDKAPPLSIAKWLKGDKIDPAKAGPDDVVVVEFWATWCPPCRQSIPHLSKLQKHFKAKNLTIVGISDEPAAKVKGFLKQGWDSKMQYVVAVDDGQKTNRAWMLAAGQKGIPTAFVVKGGKITWIGHPLNGLDLQVAEQCGDKQYARQAKKLADLQGKLHTALQNDAYKKAIKIADEILVLRPDEHETAMLKFSVLATKIKDTRAATQYGYELVKHCDSAEALNGFAWALLTHSEFSTVRDLKLATAGAEKALKLSHEKDASILDTYARALADSGRIKEAIKYQEKAIERCEIEAMLKDLRKTLKEYKKKAV